MGQVAKAILQDLLTNAYDEIEELQELLSNANKIIRGKENHIENLESELKKLQRQNGKQERLILRVISIVKHELFRSGWVQPAEVYITDEPVGHVELDMRFRAEELKPDPTNRVPNENQRIWLSLMDALTRMRD